MQAKPARAYANPEANARRYKTPAGDRLNLSAIITQFGVTADAFEGVAQRRKLRAKVESRPGGGCPERTWLESQVAEALRWSPYLAEGSEGPGWVDEHTYRDKRGDWLTLLGAEEEFPDLSRKSVQRWACEKTPCRFLTDKDGNRRAIDSQQVAPARARNVKEVTVYLRADLKELQSRRNAKPSHARVKCGRRRTRLVAEDVYEDEMGVWLTGMQAHDAHAVNDSEFCYRWAERESLLRPREKALRPKTIPNPVCQKGGPGEVMVFLESDLLEILAGNESDHPFDGRGPHKDAVRRQRLEAAKKYLREIMGNRRMRPAHVYAKMKRQHGMPKRLVRSAFKDLKGREVGNGRARLWQLPFATPAALSNPPPFAGNEVPQAVPEPNVAPPSADEAASPGTRGKRRGGRPKGPTEDWKNRKRAMIEGWDRGDYGDNKAEAGRAHDFHRSDATNIINAHEREKRRKNSQR
jgi:hypothetical protein